MDYRAKLYSWHAAELKCITKVNSRNPYEFGVKVGQAMTLKGIMTVTSFTKKIEQIAILMQGLGVKPEMVK